jgi:MoxR-like ATPase
MTESDIRPEDVSPALPPEQTDARDRLAAVRAEVAKAVVGQDAAVSGLLVALLCGGHVLMEGVPGVAKTLLVRARNKVGIQALLSPCWCMAQMDPH